MKRLLSLLLGACIALSLCPALGEETVFDDDGEAAIEAEAAYTGPAYAYDHLTVGTPTAVSGNFTTQMWGYSTSDVDVTALVNGYNLVSWHMEEGNFQIDTSVVSGINVSDDPAGDRSYTLGLRDDLTWSDGTPITAYDYAFSILLSASPLVREMGGDNANYLCLQGTEAYRTGEAEGIAGVEVIGDNLLNLTVSGEYRPFFYELGLLWCYPMPLHVIAPECRIVNGDTGAQIEGPFTRELLEKTLLDEETGYVSHPSVVSGPYRLVSYDRETGEAEFEINEAFAGTEDGTKPMIQQLSLRHVTNGTMIQQLEAGELGLINKVLAADSVTQGIQLAGSGNYAMTTYARTGQSFISFNCEKDIVSSQTVRQAVAYCLDKDETVLRYTGNYGLRADGYYGIGQWMVQVLTGSMAAPVAAPEEGNEAARQAYEAELESWAALSMDGIPVYNQDADAAARLLEEDGWTLNEAGQAFTAGKDPVRCKDVDGVLVPLALTLAVPDETDMGDVLAETFLPGLEAAGIQVTMVPMDWQTLLRQYYRQEPRECHMMALASNFNEVFDPWPTFDPADAETGMANYTGIADQELYEKARDMSRTEPGDALGYLKKWLEFQKRYQEVVPAIPIYSNAYFDFYTRYLKNYDVSANVTWTEAIVSAYLSDPGSAEEEEEEFPE